MLRIIHLYAFPTYQQQSIFIFQKPSRKSYKNQKLTMPAISQKLTPQRHQMTKKTTHFTLSCTQYQNFLRQRLQYLRPETFSTDLLYVSNVGTFHDLL